MKKLLYALTGFVVGGALVGLAVANPFGWTWLPGAGPASTDMAAEPRIKYWVAPMDPTYIRDAPGKSPMGMDLVPVYEDEVNTAAEGAEPRIKYWVAPMDPTYIRDAPGKSPMGMDLVPVYEDEVDTAPGIVAIDPGFVQSIGVQTEPARRVDIPFTIRTIGTLVYNDSQIALVTTKYEGWIEKAYVNYVGEPVEVGDPLFDDAMLDAARQRLGYWDVTDSQIAELQASRTPRRTLAFGAARSGVVVWKMDQAMEGMHVTPGMNLYRIADVSTIWADVEVFENQIPWLRLGQRATIELPYESGRRVTGHVRYLYPFLTEETRALKVSIELPNPGARLRVGMYANVIFDVPSATGVLAVPEEAVIRSGTRNVIVIALGEGRFHVRDVVLGVNGNGLWEVKTGLDEGEQVVVSAQFLIDSESSLREAIRKITSGMGGGAG
jgi:Cu(I)/Ag(I) efflux system membrane fusion protein/cobalt-zinc-cadmium efflux system membrane fusion protein